MEAIPRLHALDGSIRQLQPFGFCVGTPTAEVPHRPVCGVRLTATGRGISLIGFIPQNHKECFEEDFDIHPDGPVSNVSMIQ